MRMTSPADTTRKTQPIIIWAGGGQGHVVIDIIREQGGWEVVGIIDNLHPRGASIMGIPVLGDADQLPRIRAAGVDQLVVAIGHCSTRATLLEQAVQLGFQTPNIIHPSSIILPSAQLGTGCVLCPLSVIGAQTRLGRGVIVNTRASIDHDNVIGDFVHVAPAATLCGFVTVGAESWIGAGAVVRDHLTIGARAMVGAGATVVKRVPDNVTVCGNPATPAKKDSSP